MKEFIIKDYHKDFIEVCNKKIDTLNKNLHICFNDITKSINTIEDKYYNYLIKYNINLKDLYNNIIIGKPLLYTNSTEENLFIGEYNYLLLKMNYIPIAVKAIKKYSFYITIPISIYKTILYNYNFEQSKLLLKGEKITLPKIGELSIIRVTYDSTKPDWGASQRFKEYLKEQGLTTKDKNNPDGKLWLVDNGLNRDDFTVTRWRKRHSKLRNKQPYRFRPSIYGNFYPKSLDRQYTIDEIINKTNTGLSDKIHHIYRFHYQYTQNNYPFYNFIKPTD